MKTRAIALATVLITMAVLDFLWIGLLMDDFYDGSALGMHARMVGGEFSPNLFYMPLGYLVYAIGFIAFAYPLFREKSLDQAARVGAAFALFTVGTYHLWNLMMLQDWSLTLAITDTFYAIMSGGVIAMVVHWTVGKFGHRSGWFTR